MFIMVSDKAQKLLEDLHLLRFSHVVNEPFFSAGLSFLFFFGILFAMSAFVLAVLKKDRYYFALSLICFLLSVLSTFVSFQKVKLSIPVLKENGLVTRIEKAVKGLGIIEKKAFTFLGMEENVALDAAGPSEDNAKRSAIGRTFDSLLKIKGSDGFGSLPEGTRQELIAGLNPFLVARGKEKGQDGVILHYSVDIGGFRKYLETLGYSPEPIRLTIDIGKNETGLDKEELQTRLAFILKKGSRYYLDGGFRATTRALSDDFEAMELKLAGKETNRMKVDSVRRSADGSYLFTVDVF